MTVSEKPLIRMYNQDCLEAMAGMEDNAFDLAIVDPPYGIGFGEFNRTNRDSLGNTFKADRYKNGDWDANTPKASYFVELLRVSKHRIIWGGNYYLEKLGSCRGYITWDKDVKVPNFSDTEFAWTSFDNIARQVKIPWNGGIRKSEEENYQAIHPTQKPIALYKWLLTNYANEGDRILDTHGGSGSICIACYDMGFDLDWFEIDTDYYNDAVQRFKNHKAQGQLFELKQTYKHKQQKLGLN